MDPVIHCLCDVEALCTMRCHAELGSIPHPAPARAVEVQGPGQEATSLGQGEASAGKRVHCRERSWGHTVGQVQLWSQTDLRSDFGLEVWGAGGLYS